MSLSSAVYIELLYNKRIDKFGIWIWLVAGCLMYVIQCKRFRFHFLCNGYLYLEKKRTFPEELISWNWFKWIDKNKYLCFTFFLESFVNITVIFQSILCYALLICTKQKKTKFLGGFLVLPHCPIVHSRLNSYLN